MKLSVEIKADIEMVGGKPPSISRFLSLLIMDSGFLAVFLYRLYSRLYGKNIVFKFLAKILWRLSVFMCGCYIQPQASIEKGFCLPHPIGVVIGEGAIVGSRVKIYQSVTLGRGSDNGYPNIQDNITIFASSTLIGKITVETGSIIGANSLVNKDVMANSVVAGVPAKIIGPRS